MKFSTVLLSLILLAGIAGMVCALSVVTPVAPGTEKGYFSFNSVPSGADVMLDGIYQGETPVVSEVSTTGNAQHTIEMNLPGYEFWSSTYQGNPAAGQTIPITATLVPSAQVGSISVTSNPSGATVILDDSRTAYTPYTYSNVPVGSHTISVYLSGYEDFYTSVNVQAGVTAQVSATLDPVVTIGSLSISSSPSGASVYVDNIYRGVTTVVVGNLQAGTHTVLLVKAGYKNWQENVNVQAGTATYLNPKLEADPAPQYATVSIQSNPTGADVYGDGVYIGRTRADGPLVFTQVTPGTHTLLVTKSGYQDQSGTQTVVAGQDYTYNVNLKPVPNPTTGSISVTSSPIGAQVYVNNVFRGYSPLTVDSLTPGMYTVALKLSGYEDWQSSATVTAGQTAQISATLLPKTVPTPTPTPTPGFSPALAVITLAGAALFLRKFTR
ncbi:MAG: PEGA domain-containing protein [Methanomicrobiales archaeon]|nr:PEGA domain-containing protein [Methanomicrobiales archaeon]